MCTTSVGQCQTSVLSLSGRTLAGDDSVAQRCGDRDEVEVRASASHCDARDGHSVQGIEVTISALFVVVLEGCYSSRDDLRLCVIPIGRANKHRKVRGRRTWTRQRFV